MKRLFACLCVLLCSSGAMAEYTLTQTDIGGGGFMYAGTFHPTNSNTVLVGVDMTGVFKSTDFGAGWAPWNAGLESNSLVGDGSNYVQDLEAIQYGGQVFYFAATLGGLYMAPEAGPWSNQTTDFSCTFFNHNEGQYETHAIPFSVVEGSGGSLVYAGTGSIRNQPNEDYFDITEFYAYPSLGRPNRVGYVFGDDVSSTPVEFDGAQYSVWYNDLSQAGSGWAPLGECTFGAARDMSAATVDGVSYLAVATIDGIYLHDGSAWVNFSDLGLVNSEGTLLSGYYGPQSKVLGWSVYLTERGTLYAAYQKVSDASDQMAVGGTYRIFDIASPNPEWEWLGDGSLLDYDQNHYSKTLAEVCNENDFVNMEVIPGTGLDPDVVLIGGRNASAYGLIRGEVPYDSGSNAEWSVKVYAKNGLWANEGAGVVPFAEMAPFDFWGCSLLFKPFVSPSDPDRIGIQLSVGMFLSDDRGVTWQNKYSTYDSGRGGWVSNGYNELGTVGLSFLSDGSIVQAAADVGLLVAADSSNVAFNHYMVPWPWQSSPSRDLDVCAVDVFRSWPYAGGKDAIVAVGGPHRGGRTIHCGVFNSQTLDYDWTHLTEDRLTADPQLSEYRFYDVAVVSDNKCYASYFTASDSKPGVMQISYDAGAGIWSTDIVWDRTNDAGLSHVLNLSYNASSNQLFMTGAWGPMIYRLDVDTNQVEEIWSNPSGWSGFIDAITMAEDGMKLVAAVSNTGSGVSSRLLVADNATFTNPASIVWQEFLAPAVMESRALDFGSFVIFHDVSVDHWEPEFVHASLAVNGAPSLFSGNGVWKCELAGSGVWAEGLEGTIADNVVFRPLAKNPVFPNHMYMGSYGQGLYRTVLPKPFVPKPPATPRFDFLAGAPEIVRNGAGVEIRYDLRRSTKISMRVFDIRGRMVNRIEVQQNAIGEHSVYWDGRSGLAAPVASGVYFVRIEAGSDQFTGKVLLLK